MRMMTGSLFVLIADRRWVTYDSGGGGFYCNCQIPNCEVCHVVLIHDGPYEDRDGAHLCRKCMMEQDEARWLIREQQEEAYYANFEN